MRRALVAMIALASGCGVEEHVAAVPPDAYPGIDTYCGCNLVAQTGCLVDEKCTWVHDVQTCAPDGALPVGAACAHSADGDDCAGGVCVGGICRAFCTLSPDSCDAPESCVAYVDSLADTLHGVCVAP